MTTHTLRQRYFEVLHDLVYNHYGLNVISSENLTGYMDFNIWVDISEDIKNTNIKERNADGYVVKLMNEHDSQNPEVMDARARLMIYVDDAGITTPLPVKSVTGSYSCLVSLDTKGGVTKRLMMVLTYIRGTLMSDLTLSSEILKEAGEIAAKLDTCMEGFLDTEHFKYDAIWKMTESARLLNLVHYAPKPAWREIAEDILNDFKEKVVPSMNQFQEGLIHHDVGPQNIVMRQDKDDGSWRVAAILDFGDVCPSYCLFEVAILLSHLFIIKASISPLSLNDIRLTRKCVLDAYTSIKHLNNTETAMLDVCFHTRLVKCCLLGEQTRQSDPENTYVNSFICWDLLESMRKLSVQNNI